MHDHGLVTVQQHIIQQQAQHPTASGEFSWLLSAITLSTKIISSYVRRAGLIDVWGEFEDGAAGESVNVQGEVQQKLDVIANETLKRTLGYRGNVGIVASEEDDDPRVIQEASRDGRYIVMFDPLDGSSNIDANVSIGTIFSVLQRPEWERSIDASVQQPGKQQLAAGYVVYGPGTVLVYTTGQGVHMFMLDPQVGAFVLVREHITMPSYGPVYSVNEAYYPHFPEPYQRYLDWCKTDEAGGMSTRYIGSLVSDFHRTLLKGGVYLYPPTMKNPDGKLRLMYEANPLAFIAEQAGGAASDGAQRILEKQPTALHERTPLIIGSQQNVDQVHQFVNQGQATAAATV